MPDARAQETIREHDRAKGDRGTTEVHWQQVARYCHVNRNDYIVERTPGVKRMEYVFDSHPIWCREQFTAGCHSLLTSSSLLWFALRVDDDAIDRVPAVRDWLEAATMAMYAVFNSPRYNFATQSQEVYDDLGSIGSATMAILTGRDGMPLFSTRHMKECLWFENEEDRVDKLIRRWQWTARQAVRQWGGRAGEKVTKAFGENPDQKFWFLHRVAPRRDRDPSRSDNRNMPFESLYVSETDQSVISEGGFRAFPFATPRFTKATGEIYGRGPGMTGLPDIKMLNECMKLVVKAAQKVIDPPLELPDDGYMVPIRTVPGSLNYRRSSLNPQDGIRPIETKGNIQIGQELLEGLRTAISRVFYVDLLRMPTDPTDPNSEGKGSTAEYWIQRAQKEMMTLSPFLARMRGECLGPIIDLTFDALWQKSLSMRFKPGSPFPPPPAILSGKRIRPEYVSPLEVAQRSSQIDAVARVIDMQQRLKTMDPESPTYVDGEFIMRMVQRDVNAPSGVIKAQEVLQQEAQAKADAEQAMAAHGAVANIASAAKDGTAALKNLNEAGGGNDNEAQEAA